MTISSLNRLLPVSLLLAALVPGPAAQAVNLRVAANTIVELASVSPGDLLNASVLPDRSYCFEIYVTGGNSLPTFSAFGLNAIGGNSPTLTVTNRGTAYPVVYGNTSFANVAKSRSCFLVNPGTAALQLVTLATITTSGGAAATNSIARVDETTLFGGYNTSVTDFNFLELTNVSAPTVSDSGVISGKVILRDAITDQEKLRQSFTINPGDRVDVNIHDAVGSGSFGPVVVLHDGPPGALKGVVSQYRIVSTVPLDFEPVSQLPLATFK